MSPKYIWIIVLVQTIVIAYLFTYRNTTTTTTATSTPTTPSPSSPSPSSSSAPTATKAAQPKFVINPPKDSYHILIDGFQTFRISELLVTEHGAHDDWHYTTVLRDADIVYTRAVVARQKHYNSAIDPKKQVVNHIVGQIYMTTKASLAILLRSRAQSALFQLPTFIMSDGGNCNDFFKIAEKNNELPDTDPSKKLWIIKHTHESQGIGTVVSPSFSELTSQFQPCPLVSRNKIDPFQESFVVQEYLKTPLLINKRKMEIRAYFIIIYDVERSAWRMHVYDDGQVRLNAAEFVLDDFSNPLIHITNVHQQQSHPDFESPEFQASLKKSWQQLDDYLVETGQRATPDFKEKVLMPKLHYCLYHIFHASAPYLSPLPGSFGFFGLDVMIDAALDKIYVNEVQTGPGMSDDDPVKAKLVRGLLLEMTDIVMEPLGRKRTITPAERHYQEIDLTKEPAI